MPWTETPDSSSIAGFGYEETSQTLTVEFKNGGKYNYFSVPENVFQELQNADSAGTFVAKNIKPFYRYEKV